MKLICDFVFAYPDRWFSYESAHLFYHRDDCASLYGSIWCLLIEFTCFMKVCKRISASKLSLAFGQTLAFQDKLLMYANRLYFKTSKIPNFNLSLQYWTRQAGTLSHHFDPDKCQLHVKSTCIHKTKMLLDVKIEVSKKMNCYQTASGLMISHGKLWQGFITSPFLITSGKHVRVMYTPLNPTLYSKTGVCRGIPIFLIFAQKHRLWVLAEAVLTCIHNLCFEQK